MMEVFEEFDKEQENKRNSQIKQNEDDALKKAQEELNEQPENDRSQIEQENIEKETVADEFSADFSNTEAFDALIEQIRQSANTARGYGTKFETLTKDWLTKDHAYKDLFTKVQTYKEWAYENPQYAGNARDTGIDLVAKNADDEFFSAIQCKMYEKSHRVGKADIDSFVSASDKDFFTRRFIVATNESWSENVENDLKNKKVPVRIIKYSELASSNVDWSAYAKGKTSYLKPRELRPYQKNAIEKVILGFKDHNRGKLIMACGTGKTFTSMKLVEKYIGPGGLVLFLVPSLSLLSQTLSDWKRHCYIHINAFAVCSDSSTGKANAEDVDSLVEVDQLAYPATTDAGSLVKQVKGALTKINDLTVVFSTYQSIDVIGEAQKQGLPKFDLTICDEAHRTAGVSYTSDDHESNFVKVHDDNFLKSEKRLYMTATPKIYGSIPEKQQADGEIILYSMSDEKVFGPTFETVSFTQAIELNCLVDYKVIVLTLDESLLEGDYGFLSTDEIGGLTVNNAAKIVGTWRALAKMDLQKDKSISNDLHHMKRAVGFAQVIEASAKYDRPSSKQFARHFEEVIELYKKKEKVFLKDKFKAKWSEEDYNATHALKVETKHIDGSMNATEKDSLLAWLREDPQDDTCKILFNVRCLSEGVDVPSLDAVIFLSPRKSQVDIVQTVGRVMRTAKGKERGYVILPIVVPTGISPDLVLNNNKDFDVVWQVLNGLKSIDPAFGSYIDGETGKIDSNKIEIICVSDQKFSRKKGAEGRKAAGSSTKGRKSSRNDSDAKDASDAYQTEFEFGTSRDYYLEEEIKSKIVKRVGNRREWGDWAEDVGEICQAQIKHIKKIIDGNKSSKLALADFTQELKATLNGELSEESVIEMLGQHVVIKPVLAALFKEYPFADENPISKAMTEILSKLDQDGMNKCTAMLEPFYLDVARRMRSADNPETRQTLIKDLFDKFFKVAFPKMKDKLGIVYTPIEIVDFINKSVDDLLRKEFNKSLADHDLHILDPFTGTGSFIVRMMQSGLMSNDDLKYKYNHDLHANEIVPLAYYIASMNIETAYHDIIKDAEYKPNDIMVWTDTFAENKKSDLFKTTLSENNKKQENENNADIRVIVGNPPYSVGQESQNDDNANEHYEKLDSRLQLTYANKSLASNKKSLYDSYIRAYRWAADRIRDSGIVAFITNAGWLDSASADGMRKCMVEEFSSIYVYHLKGNQRTSGERSRQEGGKIFGEGSRAPVAIVFLVKNPHSAEKGKIYFHAVDDYLTREQKLAEIRNFGSVQNMNWDEITPDKHGDWLNQKDDSFENYRPIFNKNVGSTDSIFKDNAVGISTNRDAWVYNFSKEELFKNISKTSDAYNKAVDRVIAGEDEKTVINSTTKEISWTRGSKNRFSKLEKLHPSSDYITNSLYRPFIKQNLYYEKKPCFIEMPGRWKVFFPSRNSENLVITVNQKGTDGLDNIALITDKLSDLHSNGDTQCFPRYIYDKNNTKRDAITDEALTHFQSAYRGHDSEISKDDIFYYIYGVLHSPEYREKYANNLSKELPRIPRVASFEQFKAFAEAGRQLADLHLNYETQVEYSDVEIKGEGSGNYYVTQMKWGKIPGKTGNAAKDKTVLFYNNDISVSNIPLEAQEYVVNKKSALDWIVERACYSQDKKSGIVNDFNQYAIEIGNPRYPLELFLKIITVSVESVKIIKQLPKLEISVLDKE